MRDIIIDGHQDIAWNYFELGRDFRLSAWEKRRREAGSSVSKQYGRSMVGLPEEILGRVALTCGTIYVGPVWAKTYPDETVLYSTPAEAYKLGIQQLEYYERLADENDQIDLIRTRRDLDAVLATWEEGTELADHHFGIIMLMEGADPILEPAQLEEWFARGLRVVGPAWTQTRYSGGTRALGPLTDLGRELLEVMAGFRMVLDLSHMAPEAALEALERYEGPLFASHANPLRFRKSRPDRNLSDDVIRGIAEHDGVIGVMPYNLFLLEEWNLGDRRDAGTMANVIAAIDHICQTCGSARYTGLGSDFDGGFGSDSAPVGFETVADLWEIGRALGEHGYSAGDITAILGGNFLRVLRSGLPD